MRPTDERIQQIIDQNRRALVGFAHYDKGERQGGVRLLLLHPSAEGVEDEG